MFSTPDLHNKTYGGEIDVTVAKTTAKRMQGERIDNVKIANYFSGLQDLGGYKSG